jgi:Subtilase family
MAILNRTALLNATPELYALGKAPLFPAMLKQVDPYLKWALVTNFEGYRAWPEEKKIPFLVQASKDRTDARELDTLLIRINGAYIEPNHNWSEYATALVDRSALVALHVQIVKDRDGACKLGLPGSTDISASTPQLAAGGGNGPFFGIIDHGIAFAHKTFLNAAGQTRIKALWDQDPESEPRALADVNDWDENLDFKYGAKINDYSINHARTVLTETAIYQKSNYLPLEKRLSHGTHVMDIAAGRDNGPNRQPHNDHASNSTIYAVQLPWRPYKDTSGSSLCVHILDALQWIRLKVGSDNPFVVNISDGAYAGPGKGRSLLERAMADMLRPKIAAFSQLASPADLRLVLAAGNGAKRRGHAAGELSASARTGQIAFHVLPDTPTETVLEVWIDSLKDLSTYGSNVKLELTSPENEVIYVDLGNDLAALADAQGKYIAMLNASDQSPDCPNTLGFVVVISPTRRPPSIGKRGVAPIGLWSIELINVSENTISFSAQIQRANPALGDKGTRREAKFAKSGAAGLYVSSGDTLNNIATGSSSITVGGCLENGYPWPDPSDPTLREVEVEYSSRGNTVSVVASSDYSLGLHGVLAAGNRSGTTVRMDGTSVAAPQVARALLNALSVPGNQTLDNATLLGAITIAAPAGVTGPPKLP